MTYRYIYIVTCRKGSFKNKYYIGQHTTDNLNDGYKGSGKLIRDYYKKYPNEDDYMMSIVCFCNSQEELNQKEYEIIHPYLHDKDCLNLSEGGHYISHKLSEEQRKNHSEFMKLHNPMKGKTPWNKGKVGPRNGAVLSEETKQKMRESAKNRPPISEETRKKLSNSHRKFNSEETKQKMRESAIKRWQKYHELSIT